MKSIKAANMKNAADLEQTLAGLAVVTKRQMLDEMMENEGYVKDIYKQKNIENSSKFSGTD